MQMVLVALKISTYEMKILPDGINSRIDSAEEISELVDILMDTIHTNAQRKEEENPTRSSLTCGTMSSRMCMCDCV